MAGRVGISEETIADCRLAEVQHQARSAYARCVAGGATSRAWWSAVIITAGSQRQAELFLEEIHRRSLRSMLPEQTHYLVVPDLGNKSMGSGGATINAIRVLAETNLRDNIVDLEQWWASQRVLIIHAGGEARRLPQYSLSGKLFSALPITTPWGEVSAVFDELLALSTIWLEKLSSGLVVTSGDMLLTFNADALHWDCPGVSGVAISGSPEVGSHHGVYIMGEHGRVQRFLQKPTLAQLSAAGGMLDGRHVAIDTGLLRFAAATAAALTELAGVHRVDDRWCIDLGILSDTDTPPPCIDLYEHVTRAMTREWTPRADEASCWHRLAAALRHIPFWCDVVPGTFTHVGTTALFRRLMTEPSSFTHNYAAIQQRKTVTPPSMPCTGMIVDSVLSGGGELGAGALAIECALSEPVRAGSRAILHGLTALMSPIEVPDDTVVHQVPVMLPTGERGTVIRAYGVDDDPKLNLETGRATWFGCPMSEILERLGIDTELVWPGIAPEHRYLWNAHLFPCTSPRAAWAFACWMFGLQSGVSVGEWAQSMRCSLATSTQWADHQALLEARTRRMEKNWSSTVLALTKDGSDVSPLLVHAPGLPTLAATGRELRLQAASRQTDAPTEAASLFYQAGRFFGQAGLTDEAAHARATAFSCVQKGVEQGVPANPFLSTARNWQTDAVCVTAPARIDFGGGWSDTPPFCLDWGGTVLNMAIRLNGRDPITTTIHRIAEPFLRCRSLGSSEMAEYRETATLMAPLQPGSPFTIPRAALRLMGLVRPGETLQQALSICGGGLEIHTNVELPMGSGLGTSSILAATVLWALAAMRGIQLTEHGLCAHVMQLEQCMATGGGWQDQAGGIFPGAKLITSGPGACQRLRVLPLAWTPARQRELVGRLVLYDTGIRRLANDLLANVVGRYLCRETAIVQVLHSIKTLAMEMSYAMADGDWDYLGELLDRHWQLNQLLDSHTTTASINRLLQDLRPLLAGAKLAGAGGGGFLMLLAKDAAAAQSLRTHLATSDYPGRIYDCAIAQEGTHVAIEPAAALKAA